MVVTQLQVRNYMGIKALDITPNDYVVRIEGRNGAGKSDTINSVWTAICGAARHPKEPIRHGQKEASISVTLGGAPDDGITVGDLLVTKRFKGGKVYLDVRTSDGSKIKESPQALLSKLYNGVSSDPQEFIDMPAKHRREYLLELTGKKADLDILDEERKSLYNERTDVGRDITRLKSRQLTTQKPNTLEEVKIADLMAELDAANEQYQVIYKKEEELRSILSSIERVELCIADLDRQLLVARQDLTGFQTEAEIIRKDLIVTPNSMPDRDAIRAKIDSVEAHNECVRQYKAANELQHELTLAQDTHENITTQISNIDQQKINMLASADLPVAGLSFDGDELYVGGIHYDTGLNEAEQVIVAFQLALASNPDLRVMRYSHWNELDSANQEWLSNWCAQHDVQIWVQVVCDAPQGGFYIEDGELLAHEVGA